MRLTPVQRQSLGSAVCVAGLSGMAYCHIHDVGMKVEEHIYYMAALFWGNIAASLLLIPFVARETVRPSARGWLVWCGASVLAALTMLGFLWSRTIGFPQMADHVGEWDGLGVSSLVFEGLVVIVAAWRLRQLARRRDRGPRARTLRVPTAARG